MFVTLLTDKGIGLSARSASKRQDVTYIRKILRHSQSVFPVVKAYCMWEKRWKLGSSVKILRAIRTGRCRERRYILTTYLFRYISECTISYSNFQNIFFASRGKGRLTPVTKIPRMPLVILFVRLKRFGITQLLTLTERPSESRCCKLYTDRNENQKDNSRHFALESFRRNDNCGNYRRRQSKMTKDIEKINIKCHTR